MFTLPHWLFPGDERLTEEIDDEIEEELRLHLDLLAEEQVREGVTPDEAKLQAAERFGDFDTLKRRCRAEKQGDVPMLKRVQACLFLAITVCLGFMGWQQYVMSSAMTSMSSLLADTETVLSDLRGELRRTGLSTETMGELGSGTLLRQQDTLLSLETVPEPRVEGAIMDPDGNALAYAHALFQWNAKSASGDPYTAYHWRRGSLHGRVSDRMQIQRRAADSFEASVAVAHPGFAITTARWPSHQRDEVFLASFDARMTQATDFTMQLRSSDGEPLPGAKVFLQSYRSPDGHTCELEVHRLNEATIERLLDDLNGLFSWRTDENGAAVARSFDKNAEVTLRILTWDGQWRSASFKATAHSADVTVTGDLGKVNIRPRGGE